MTVYTVCIYVDHVFFLQRYVYSSNYCYVTGTYVPDFSAYVSSETIRFVSISITPPATTSVPSPSHHNAHHRMHHTLHDGANGANGGGASSGTLGGTRGRSSSRARAFHAGGNHNRAQSLGATEINAIRESLLNPAGNGNGTSSGKEESKKSSSDKTYPVSNSNVIARAHTDPTPHFFDNSNSSGGGSYSTGSLNSPTPTLRDENEDKDEDTSVAAILARGAAPASQYTPLKQQEDTNSPGAGNKTDKAKHEKKIRFEDL